ncbi:MAG: MmcQ/YjbR family DNA-binding protein [Treponema sp.]|nr:MmcQ/YjbR family DNA-binding protein [Treponema sp.]
MDFSYIFRSAKLIPENLEKTGFSKKTISTSGQGSELHSFTLRRDICGGDFYAVIELNQSEETLTAQVFDSETKEKYTLFDSPRSHGSFVASMREEVQNIIKEIRAACFASADLKEKYIAFLKERFGSEADFPWEDTPDFCVFRCENQKWFALIMKIKYRQLSLTGDEEVWVVDLKADSGEIESLIDRKSIFPAWHMNKKHWITVLLTAVTDFDRLCALTERSFNLVR